jgi:hypothetical protein
MTAHIMANVFSLIIDWSFVKLNENVLSAKFNIFDIQLSQTAVLTIALYYTREFNVVLHPPNPWL